MKLTINSMSKFKNNEMEEIHGCNCNHTRRDDFRRQLDHSTPIEADSISEIIDDEFIGLGWATVVMPCTGLTKKRLVIAANSKNEAVDQDGNVYSRDVYHPDGEDIPETY